MVYNKQINSKEIKNKFSNIISYFAFFSLNSMSIKNYCYFKLFNTSAESVLGADQWKLLSETF